MVYRGSSGRFGSVDDMFKVKKFVRKNFKPEDPIPDKSKNRVIESLARSIRRTPPLLRGQCQLCETMADKLVPIPMNVCSGCVKRFIKKSENIRFLKFEFGEFYCDWCLGKGFKKFYINPYIDKKCMDKLGRKHVTGAYGLNEKIKRAKQRKMDIIRQSL